MSYGNSSEIRRTKKVPATKYAEDSKSCLRRIAQIRWLPIAKTIEWLELGHDATFRDRSGETAQAERFSLTLADGRRIDLDRRITFA